MMGIFKLLPSLIGNPGIGMSLSLTDFDCAEEAPSWLPRDKWEDILAISVLPGPLDSLCVKIATNSDQWKEWYRSDAPEKEEMPIAGSKRSYISCIYCLFVHSDIRISILVNLISLRF